MNENKRGLTLHGVMCFIAWITGVLVSLAVGFSMTAGGILNDSIPFIPGPVTAVAGWIVIALTVIGAVLAMIDRLVD